MQPDRRASERSPALMGGCWGSPAAGTSSILGRRIVASTTQGSSVHAGQDGTGRPCWLAWWIPALAWSAQAGVRIAGLRGRGRQRPQQLEFVRLAISACVLAPFSARRQPGGAGCSPWRFNSCEIELPLRYPYFVASSRQDMPARWSAMNRSTGSGPGGMAARTIGCAGHGHYVASGVGRWPFCCPIVAPWSHLSSEIGAPCRTRTCDLRIRSPLLYPAELRAREDEVPRARGRDNRGGTRRQDDRPRRSTLSWHHTFGMKLSA
jgi:hypothetical protein